MSERVATLPERWAARWDQAREWMGLGVQFIPVGERLLELYSAPGRHYHDGRHVLACLEAFDNFPGNVRDNDAVEMALWYHDAVYDVRAAPGKNEADSAALYRHEFGLLVRGLIEEDAVRRLILATRHHAEPGDGDEALIMDIDLGTLVAKPARYDLYADEIRQEYAHVPEDAYREGRGAVLRGFLERKRIYQTRHFRKLLEKQARQNLQRELMALGE
jgi:predicted metal-dependent HD superfamily phosphohydrolase